MCWLVCGMVPLYVVVLFSVVLNCVVWFVVFG